MNMFAKSGMKPRLLRRKLNMILAHVCEDLALASKTTTEHTTIIRRTAAGFQTSSKMDRKTTTLNNMNPNIKLMEYAVRGQLVIRAGEIEKELKKSDLNMPLSNIQNVVRGPLVDRSFEIEKELLKGVKKPFDEVIRANIGDCHAMGQKPITFIRQVLVLCTYPELMKDDRFPADVKKRAQDLLKGCGGGSVGSYTDSAGIELIKEHVTEYIKERDGIPANITDIILSTGASEGVKSVLSMFNCQVNGKPPGVMVPIPQYPLYSATIAEYGMHMINYYLDEDNAWALDIQELKRAIKEARNVCEPRAIVIINPGNPTGSVLTRKNIKEIIKFAYDEKLFLMADEVYQDNIYPENMKFYSFKKVMTELGEPYKNMELASFMSASKGYMGECGLRGGYCELVNVDADVKKMLLKCVSARLCSSVLGQITMDCIVKPPQKGDPSYDLFIKEKSNVLKSLKERALLVEHTFNKMRGMKCNAVVGAMYAFPRITLPEKAIQKAKSLGQAPDFFYAMQLLENTGICVVPGSGFGQIPGTYHFRTTILPQTDKLKAMLKRLEEYHEKFMDEYK